MPNDLHLGLRNHRDSLTAMKRPGGPGLVLARRHPNDENSRARVLEHWGWPAHSPRRQPEATIDIPLSLRETIAVSMRLPRDVRDALNGGSMSPDRARHAPHPQPLAAHAHDAIPALEASPHRRRAHGVFADDPAARRARYAPGSPRVRR